MKSCIIFACTIVSKQRLVVLHRFLESFKEDFADCDIFVGVNCVSLPEVEGLIMSYGLNVISMSRCQDHLYTQSDASAYQTALKDLTASGKRYDNYWFLHTKSGVNDHSDYLREWYIESFLKNRHSIESFMHDTPGIGSYGMLGLEFDKDRQYSESDCEIALFDNKLTDDLPCTHSNFFYIHTLYVIGKEPMEKFLSLVSDLWYNSKLDRYYFEGVFPFIVSRAGYFPYIENRYSCSGLDLQPLVEEWVDINNLESYREHANAFKTNFTFHQLNPPYANSNT